MQLCRNRKYDQRIRMGRTKGSWGRQFRRRFNGLRTDLRLQTVETKSWSVNGVPAGTWVESRNLTYVKIFNSSHMVPYDVPEVAHDMMLRFMGVDFSKIIDGTARIPSKIGDEEKPVPVLLEGESKTDSTIPVPAGKSPEQDKAMWEGIHNIPISFSKSEAMFQHTTMPAQQHLFLSSLLWR